MSEDKPPILTLMDVVDQLFHVRDVSDGYLYTLRRRAELLSEFAETDDLKEVLTEVVVNGYLAMRAKKLSPYTLRSLRGDLLTLWNAAADEDLVPYPMTRRIRRIKRPELIIECYTVEEVRILLEHVSKLKRCFPDGTVIRDYWPAIIRTAWDTGLRRGDLWRLRRDAIRSDGTARVIQHKTGRATIRKLRPSTIEAIDKLYGPTPLSFPLVAAQFGRHWQKFTKATGINRGTFKWVRRASGSYVELGQIGAGSKHLGHTSSEVFERHYNAKLDTDAIPLPPDLDAPAEAS